MLRAKLSGRFSFERQVSNQITLASSRAALSFLLSPPTAPYLRTTPLKALAQERGQCRGRQGRLSGRLCLSRLFANRSALSSPRNSGFVRHRPYPELSRTEENLAGSCAVRQTTSMNCSYVTIRKSLIFVLHQMNLAVGSFGTGAHPTTWRQTDIRMLKNFVSKTSNPPVDR
jgi:hypothetical protein